MDLFYIVLIGFFILFIVAIYGSIKKGKIKEKEKKKTDYPKIITIIVGTLAFVIGGVIAERLAKKATTQQPQIINSQDIKK